MTRAIGVGLAGLLMATALYPSSSKQGAHRPVLFALQRGERLHAFDAETLEHLGHFVTGPLGDSLGARADGRMLFLLQLMRDMPNSCCSLRTLDLATREMCWVGEPAVGEIVVSGGIVAVGGKVFDAQTLAPALTPRASFGAFAPSPDGRHTARVDFRGPVLIFTSLATSEQQTIPIPEEARAVDWVGDRYMLLAAGPGKGRLWAVSPSDTALPAPREVTWPDSYPRSVRTFALGSDLVSYMRFGAQIMMDLRERGGAVPGGALVIPSAGGAARRIAKDVYFAGLVPGVDGRSLFAVEAGPLQGQAVPVRLLRLDARTGNITATSILRDPALFPGAAFDVWSLALANVPENLIPRGELRPRACSR